MHFRNYPSIAAAVLCTSIILATPNAHAAEFHGHWIDGRILETYNRLGGYGTFGDAVTDELVAGNNGRYQDFQHRDASIYWHPNASNGVARHVEGRIKNKWGNHGFERGRLGYPITDELPAGNSGGRFNHFEHGSIYWSHATDAQKVEGRIRDYWASTGWESGRFGFPTEDEFPVGDGSVQQRFQGQILQWVPSSSRIQPGIESRYSSYNFTFNLHKQDERWSAEATNREVTTNFSKYFPFTGCGSKLTIGTTCDLETNIGPTAPVRVEQITNNGFTFVSLEGHPEGAGRTINFKFLPASSSDQYIRINIEAGGPEGGLSVLGPLNSIAVAFPSWALFSKNIEAHINESEFTYITADKATPGTGPLRVSEARPSTDQETSGIAINPRDVDTSMIGDKVPLIPVGEEADSPFFNTTSGVPVPTKTVENPATNQTPSTFVTTTSPEPVPQ